MHRKTRLAAIAALAVLAGCQVITGIETRNADPIFDKGCAFKKSGVGHLRFANFNSSTQLVDLCTASSGEAYHRSLLHGLSVDTQTACGVGLSTTQVTTLFGVDSAKVDAKVIPYNGHCTDPGLAEITGITVGPDVPLTLIYMGTDEAPKLSVIAESSGASLNRKVRFVNAIPDSKIDVVAGVDKVIPTKVSVQLVTPAIDYGAGLAADAKPVPGTGSIENGYWSQLSAAITLGVALDGSSEVSFLYQFGGTTAGAYSMYAYGDKTQPASIRGLVCQDVDDPVNALIDCTKTDVNKISVDVFNAGLYGAFAAVESTRAPQVIAKLSQRPSDIMCITEVGRHRVDSTAEPQSNPADAKMTQEELIEQAKANGFIYSYQANGKAGTDLDTPLPPNADGVVEPDPTYAPCAKTASVTFNDAYSCLSTNCGTPPGDDGVSSGGASCYGTSCTGPLANLLFAGLDDRRCFGCLIVNGVSLFPWGTAKSSCLNEVKRPYGFRGATPSLILSKHPLSNMDTLVLPSTLFRRAVLYAKVTMNDTKKDIDFYCAQMPANLGQNLPYTGNYSSGLTDATGALKTDYAGLWQEEAQYASSVALKWIKDKSGGKGAIIAGDFSASVKTDDNSVQDLDPQVVQTFIDDPTMTQAMGPGYVPRCTRCSKNGQAPSQNIYNSKDSPNVWTLRTFVMNKWTGNANPTVSSEVFFDEPDAVTLNPNDGFGVQGPLADTFGYNVVIQQPQ